MRSLAARWFVLGLLLAPGLVGQGQFVPKDWLDTNAPVEQCIAFALYTTHANTLKLTAQLYPLADGVERDVLLSVRTKAEGGGGDEPWREVARVAVDETLYGRPQPKVKRWLAHFRVEEWDPTRDFDYRVTAAGGKANFEGVVRRDPIEKDVVVVASLSCNGNYDRGPRADIVRNLKHQDPDLLFFAGDQSYDHKRHYQAWLLFGRQFCEVLRDRPAVTIPDDHDIGQGNVWGDSGKHAKTSGGGSGGYHWSPQYVNAVQAAQTWHLPDPFDARPVQRGIGVYYTGMRVGGIGFAILEDRKFKSGPAGLIAGHKGRPDHFNEVGFDTMRLDVPEARLLGDRQLRFLDEWSQDWRGVEMKAVLSQTVFANAAHLHGPGVWGKRGAVDLRKSSGQRLIADLDSNGWPQAGRNRALVAIRKGFATMLAGDQHLATLVHHGVNEFGDAGVSFVSPSIVNYYVRRWSPLEEPVRKLDGGLPMCGDYYDGFKNKITMLSYVNPDPDRIVATAVDGNQWGPRAEGYGLVHFDKAARTMRYEVWPRMVDATVAGAKPYAGWPVTRSQQDQYGRAARAWLPEVVVVGVDNPVVQVVSEHTREIVYTLRIRGNRFRPKVFRPGAYTVRVSGQPGRSMQIEGIASVGKPEGELEFRFESERVR